MKRIYVDAPQLTTLRLFFRDFGIWHLIGSHSITVPSLRTKIVLRSVCRPWRDKNGAEYLMTPGEAARAELDRAFPDLKRVGWLAPQIKLFDRQVPLLFTGPYKGELFYVDISGAYCEVYKSLWLDVRYPCGRGVRSLAGVGEALADWKQARNSVVGVCRSRSAQGVKGNRTHVLATTNKYLAPELWATIAGVLQHIASIAERTCHACYVNTDGFLFRSELDYDVFTTILRGWGVAFKTERGPGEIRSWGSYEVGGKRAGRAGGVAVAREFSTLAEPFPGLLAWWLHQRERIK